MDLLAALNAADANGVYVFEPDVRDKDLRDITKKCVNVSEKIVHKSSAYISTQPGSNEYVGAAKFKSLFEDEEMYENQELDVHGEIRNVSLKRGLVNGVSNKGRKKIVDKESDEAKEVKGW